MTTEYQKPKEVSAALGRFENSGIVAGVAAAVYHIQRRSPLSPRLAQRGYQEAKRGVLTPLNNPPTTAIPANAPVS